MEARGGKLGHLQHVKATLAANAREKTCSRLELLLALCDQHLSSEAILFFSRALLATVGTGATSTAARPSAAAAKRRWAGLRASVGASARLKEIGATQAGAADVSGVSRLPTGVLLEVLQSETGRRMRHTALVRGVDVSTLYTCIESYASSDMGKQEFVQAVVSAQVASAERP